MSRNDPDQPSCDCPSCKAVAFRRRFIREHDFHELMEVIITAARFQNLVSHEFQPFGR